MKRRLLEAIDRKDAVAAVTSVNDPAWQSPEGKWSDKVTIAGDIVNPDLNIVWDCLTIDPVI